MLRYASNPRNYVTMTMRPPKDPLLVVLGATGTGKSQLAIDLAKRFNGEVINGDAMQMYDGLPIITNKITVEEQQGIPHHLLGFIALNEEPWRVGLFKKKAGQIIREIRSRERLPIVVGGTHYYTQSLVFEDSLLKDQVAGEEQDNTEYSNEEIVERFPVLAGSTETMIERLRGVDPVMADRWHPKDRRKIRRSLEIFLTSGKKASDHYAEQKERKLHEKVENGTSTNLVGDGSTLLFWVHAESESLKQRLDARVDKMLDAGLLDEVKSMEAFLSEQLKSGVIVDRTRGIWVSIGWKEFEPYLKALETGNVSKEDLKKLLELSIEQTKAATRQYAKRQVRWIRLNLMPALSDENVLNKLYLLDGTDITQWAGAVSDPAISVAAKFLEGSKLPLPHEMSEAARKILSPTDGLDEKPDVWFRQECEICHMVAVNDVQWQTHLKSRRHRALAKKKQKNEANVPWRRNRACSKAMWPRDRGLLALPCQGNYARLAECFRNPLIVAGGLAKAEMSQPYRRIVSMLQVTLALIISMIWSRFGTKT